MPNGAIASAASTLESRFKATHFIPMLLFIFLVTSLLLAGAPGRSPSLNALRSRVDGGEWSIAALTLGASLLGALVLRPFQIQIVRLLEGYWGDTRLLRRFGGYLTSIQRVRYEQLYIRRASATVKGQEDVNRHIHELEETSAVAKPDAGETAQRLRRWLIAGPNTEAVLVDRLRWYPAPERLLPTRLGNTLRSAEDTAGERYGFDTIPVWPRLYPLLKGPLKEQIEHARDGYDTSARLSAGLLLTSFVTAILLLPNGDWWRALPLILATLAYVSYRGACTGAKYYGLMLHVAFDLFRFDLIDKLRLEPVTTPDEELSRNIGLTKFFKESKPQRRFPYQYASAPAAPSSD